MKKRLGSLSAVLMVCLLLTAFGFAAASGSLGSGKPEASLIKAPAAAEELYCAYFDQELVYPGKAEGGTLVYRLDGVKWSEDIPTADSAGIYKVYYKVLGDENHADTAEAFVEVSVEHSFLQTFDASQLAAPATCTSSVLYYESCICGANNGVTFEFGEPLGHKWTYSADGSVITATCGNDKTHVETAAIVISGDAVYNEGKPVTPATVKYSDAWPGGELTVEYADNTETGTAKAFMKLGDLTAQKEFSIKGAMPEYTAPTAIEGLLCGLTDQTLVDPGTASGGKLVYSLDGVKWSEELPTAKSYGEYKVYYKVLGDENHADTAEAYITVVISHKFEQVPDVSQLVSAATCTKSAVYYENCICGANNGVSFEFGEPLGHKWTYSADGSVITATCGNDKTHVETAKIEINGSGFTYNGKAITPATVRYSDGWPVGELTLEYADNINAGTATVTAKLGSVTASAKFEIQKASVEFTAPSAIEGLVCSLSEQPLVTEGFSAGGGKFVYKLNNGAWSENVPTAKTCGEYKVYYKIIGDKDHAGTDEECIEVSISHKFEQAADIGALVSPATCTERAVYYENCICGVNNGVKFEYGEPLGHDYVHHDGKPATCTEKGWVPYDTCKRCDYSSYAELDIIPHVYESVKFTWADDFTCTAEARCHCGASFPVECVVTSEITKEPLCTIPGERMYTVAADYVGGTETSFKKETIPATGHNYNTPIFNWTESNICTVEMKCRCGETVPAEMCRVTHETTLTPTCSREGVETYTAKVTHGGESYQDIHESKIAKLPHTEDAPVVKNVVDPDCENPGRKDLVVCCARCGLELDRTTVVIDALGHDLKHHPAMEPDCTRPGWGEYDTCNRCSYTTYVEIPAKGHVEVSAVTEPTCVNEGFTTYTCSVCNNVRFDNYVPELGHEFDAPAYTWSNDHKTAVATVKCSRCGDNYFNCTVSETITQEPNCVDTGIKIYTAAVSINNQLYMDTQYDFVPAKGHSMEKTVTPATCTRGGYTTNTCSVCGATKVTDLVAMTGHKYTDKVTAATCTDQGYTTHTCANCGDTYKDSYTNALGHNYKNGICTRCGDGGANLKAPTVTASNNATTGKVTLKWTAVTGAAKYEIYRSTSKNGTYTKLTTVSGTSLTNSSAKVNTTYYYKVRALNSQGLAGNFSSVVSRACDCAAPVVKASNVSSTGKIKLTWAAVDGAAKYEVYRATSKTGTYTKLTTVTGTSVTNSSAVAGKTYYYKVKAISTKNTSSHSAYSAIVSRVCDCARPTPTIDLASGHPRLKWAASSGATKYEIYRATSKSGTYTKVGTSALLTYTDKTAKAGTTYYYKVMAVTSSTSSANSAYSAVVSIRAK